MLLWCYRMKYCHRNYSDLPGKTIWLPAVHLLSSHRSKTLNNNQNSCTFQPPESCILLSHKKKPNPYMLLCKHVKPSYPPVQNMNTIHWGIIRIQSINQPQQLRRASNSHQHATKLLSFWNHKWNFFLVTPCKIWGNKAHPCCKFACATFKVLC